MANAHTVDGAQVNALIIQWILSGFRVYSVTKAALQITF